MVIINSPLVKRGKVLSRLTNDTGSSLVEANARYGRLVERSVKRGRVSPTRAKRLLSVREKYFKLLQTIPFAREVLSKKEAFTIITGGHPQEYTLLKTGIAFNGFDRPVVMVLNPLGRGQLFYKSTGHNSGKPGAWLPFRGLQFTEIIKGYAEDWWYQKYAGHPNIPDYLVAVGREIAKREHEIDFKRKWDMDQVEALKEYFG
jgi:hypothetical protein